eukprot:TRINITY_DN9303_c0_g1_i2.p1 TRINITY_DN9303_c0_g1~~TRINITY_DN9303_c0_g1_i2.p1  ORF type:complete len:568 (-),score=109.71 TRINITY_DN9303_c0_g1_i2:52-1755(-)
MDCREDGHRMEQDDDNMSAVSYESSITGDSIHHYHEPTHQHPHHHHHHLQHRYQQLTLTRSSSSSSSSASSAPSPLLSPTSSSSHSFNGSNTVGLSPPGQSLHHHQNSTSLSPAHAQVGHFNSQLPGSPPMHPILSPSAVMPVPTPPAVAAPSISTGHHQHAHPQMHHLPQSAASFQLAAQHHAQQLSTWRYKEQLGARLRGKQEALEFMIHRLAMNDDMWKVVDLEEYTLENPDVVITDKHVHDLACALRTNSGSQSAASFQLAAQHHAQQLSTWRYKEQLGARLRGKQEALEFMIHRLAMNDDMWKVVDLEEYTLENPDVVITDKHVHDLACALRTNTKIVAIRLPECEGLVTWNALWPFFESLKHNKSVTRVFVSSSGKIFGHVVSVFLTNSILGFFDCNYTIRTLGSFSKAATLKKDIRVSLNRNILHHYVPKKVSLLRRLWHLKVSSQHALKGAGNDALSLLFEFDEHLQMIRSIAKGKGMRVPNVLGADPCSPKMSFVATSEDLDDDCEFDMEEHDCSCGEYTSQPSSRLGKRPFDLQDVDIDPEYRRPTTKRSKTYGDDA